jgi:hypothetical protein
MVCGEIGSRIIKSTRDDIEEQLGSEKLKAYISVADGESR